MHGRKEALARKDIPICKISDFLMIREYFKRILSEYKPFSNGFSGKAVGFSHIVVIAF